jgi:hypothetical protein
VELDGLTGKIKFDEHGLRTGFHLHIIELKKSGLAQVNIRKKINLQVKIRNEIV